MRRLGLIAVGVFVAVVGVATVHTAAAGELSVWGMPEGYKVDRFGKKIFTLDRGLDLGAL